MPRHLVALGLMCCVVVGWPSAGTANGQSSGQASPAAAGSADQAWIGRSNEFANLLIDIEKKHSPERASADGLSQYDELVTSATQEDDAAETAENRAALAKLQAALTKEQNKYVRQDLEIMTHATQLSLKRHDFAEAHQVPFLNASGIVYQGLRVLLDDQVDAKRKPAAVVRLRKYTGAEGGFTPLTEQLRKFTGLRLAKPNMIFPSRASVETGLSRNQLYVDGIAALFKQYGLQGWEEPYAKLKTQLADYDQWVKSEILPNARTDFREPPELYALNLEGYGIDIPPAELAAMAHKAFAEYQAEMQTIAAQIAKKNGWPSGDYRDVIKKLKENQLVGDAILPFYQQRLKEIEGIIAQRRLVTLPDRPARIRIGSPAESAQQPAPHMIPPPLLNNTGQQGEFVLPLNMPAAPGSAKAEKVDDYTFDAASWTLIAHEARPGHELQFDSMIEHGVSLARSRYAFNSTNVEGWGLYAEYITKPYMPLEGQLISLQFRLLRAERAFLDPELQSGKIQPGEAMKVLTEDGMFSAPFANQEVERYTFRSPGQANSYFYGYTKLLDLRRATEAALGAKFDGQQFHDFILSQGLLPPDLMRKAVNEDFIPAHSKATKGK
ncbi:MAG TPA: DUF885 domain-containing protein [Candidatus Eisenbacteria bacterium]|nr:DUF885 domain-containing protein [Candidatus Eisenbacteria bacterium]